MTRPPSRSFSPPRSSLRRAARKPPSPRPLAAESRPANDTKAMLAQYATVTLTTDTTVLTPKERKMIPLLIDAAQAMDGAFWRESYGNKDSLLQHVPTGDARKLAEINYGPWNRLANNEPFVAEIGSKPAGANYYPQGMTKGEFDSAAATSKARGDSLKSLYTVIRRDDAGRLIAIPYHTFFAAEHERAAKDLTEAAKLAEDPALKKYLTARAAALRSDDYQQSDFDWMAMKKNTLDVIVGPVETYEDELFGYKAGHEGLVVVKDKSWSARLEKYTAMLPSLQKGIPVPEAYRKEKPASGSELNAYDVLYYGGEANTGAKTIAVNLPNDEFVTLKAGTRRLQLKNAMRAKFDVILVPIAKQLIADDQNAVRQLRRVLRERDVPRSGARARCALSDQGHHRHRPLGAQGTQRRTRRGEGRHPRPLHGAGAQRARRSRQGGHPRQLCLLPREPLPLECASPPPTRTAARTSRRSTSSRSRVPSRATPPPAATAWTSRRCAPA